MAEQSIADAWTRVHGFALSLPEATEDLPWGHPAIKVRGKTFVFMGNQGPTLSLSVKLPQSSHFALDYPFTAPTGYGLGRSGWVSASFAEGDTVPLDVLEAWIGESYRAVAPRTLARRLDAG
ncbi:MAG: MmcQ/YjbR family DNA-binding protein [Azospirillaceae bacterium]